MPSPRALSRGDPMYHNASKMDRAAFPVPTTSAAPAQHSPGGRVRPSGMAADVTSAAPVRIFPVLFTTGNRVATMVFACALTWMLLNISGLAILDMQVRRALPYVILPLLVVAGLVLAGAFRLSPGTSKSLHIASLILGAGVPALAATMFGRWFETPAGAEVLAFVATTVASSAAALQLAVFAMSRAMAKAGRLSENIVIVGATENARRLILRNAESRDLNIIGVFDDRLSRAPQDLAGVPVLGRIDDLMTWEHLPSVDRIVVTVTSEARHRVRSLIDRLRILPHRIVLLLDLDGFDPESASLSQIAHSPAAYVSGAPRDARRAIVKQGSDTIFAALLLVLFSPVFLAVAIAVSLDSPGPVLFRQKRHGFNNQIIRVWKFRSMVANPDAADRMSEQTRADDPRVTRVGRFIRRTSLDELPQLVNVLTGEMSLVGPRPHALGMTAEAIEVNDIVGDYAHRHRVKPGITGWAQINGSRGPVHSKEEVRERIRLDLEYVNRSSFWFDLYIMLLTAPRLLGDASRNR